MSYFPTDIPYMSEEEKQENGIQIPKEKKTEYIRKQDAVDVVAFGITIASAFNNETGERIDLFVKENDELRKAIKRIHDLPSADVVQVRHARWERYSGITIRCSRCEHVIHDWRLPECKYCPNCGAKMDRG